MVLRISGGTREVILGCLGEINTMHPLQKPQFPARVKYIVGIRREDDSIERLGDAHATRELADVALSQVIVAGLGAVDGGNRAQVYRLDELDIVYFYPRTALL